MLGKRFFVTKKFPLVISLADTADWQAQVDSAVRSTPLTLQGGGTLALRVGRVADDPERVADNIATAMAAAVAHIGGWINVRNLFVKTALSASLPVYKSPPLERERELQLRETLLANSHSVRNHGPLAKQARKTKLAEFEAKLATDPRADKKREFAFLFEHGIEVDDDLFSDSTEDGAAEPAATDAANNNDDNDDSGDEDDDDDDDDDENSDRMLAIEQKSAARQKKLLSQHEAKRQRRALGQDEDDDAAAAQESVAALKLKAQQLAAGKKPATAAAVPAAATPASADKKADKKADKAEKKMEKAAAKADAKADKKADKKHKQK